jgi:hypothetical protein
MTTRRNFYVAGPVAASLAYTFTVLSFTGEFHLLRWLVFIVFFGVAFVGFERFVEWEMGSE